MKSLLKTPALYLRGLVESLISALGFIPSTMRRYLLLRYRMPTRFESRGRALQVFYLWDMRRQTVEDAIQAYYDSLYSEIEEVKPDSDPFMELVAGTVAKMPELDEAITKNAANWRLDRRPMVDRNLLRLVVYESLHGGAAVPVAIDQALKLARRFSGDESAGFVNAVAKGRAAKA